MDTADKQVNKDYETSAFLGSLDKVNQKKRKRNKK